MAVHALAPARKARRFALNVARSGRGQYPFVSEEQFDRRIRRHADLPLTDTASGLNAVAIHYLEDSAVEEAIGEMRLSFLERRILELRVDGAPMREVAARLGITKSRVECCLRRIRRQYRTKRASASDGWQDVYLQETRRAGK